MNFAKKLLALIAIACAFAANARAQESAVAPSSAPSAPEPQFHFETVLTAHGKIASIERERRLVTINWENGARAAIEVRDPKNLDAVKVGDHVKLDYIEGVAIRKMKAGEKLPLISFKQGLIGAQPGEAPRKGAHRRLEFVASVARIDPANQEVTLKGPDGSEETVMVENPETLNRVKVGDQIVITLSQGMALSIVRD